MHLLKLDKTTGMKKVINFLIVLFAPYITFTQVQVQKTNPSNINIILPFYNNDISRNANLVSYSIPIENQHAQEVNPPNIIYDSAYDETDDTTYDYKPILNYGNIIKVKLGIGNGNWQTVRTGKVWTLKLLINNAYNTSLHIDNFSLSPTASFYITSGDMSFVKGPFTKEGMSGILNFGTFPLDGNSCYIYLFEPNDYNIETNIFSISAVVGGYEPIGDFTQASNVNALEPDRPNPTRCIPSIICYPDWMNSALAVSMWANGAGSACSGTLLNNESADGTSYFYSAQHCLPGDVTDLERAAFQFKFWQTGCNNGINASSLEFFGATLLHSVGHNDGDAILLRLNSGPGIADRPTYAGWNRQNSNPKRHTGGIIHHPRAGDMRFTEPDKIRDFLWDWDFWKVSYSFPSGLVLPGSSGSGLLNENHQVIGNLSRGFPQTCFFRLTGDRYGKFHAGWDGMREFLSPTFDNNEVGSLSLSDIKIEGNSIIGCSRTEQEYTIQNLTGCTYVWTVSNNLAIVGGAGTNKILVSYIGGNQQIETDWIIVEITDIKGSIPNGRRATFRINVQTGEKITGKIEQQGSSISPLNTVNFIKANVISHTEFTSNACNSTTSTLTNGNPQWSFANNGNYGHLYVSLNTGQSATFDITTSNESCGTILRTVTYVASSGGYYYEVNPNPASTFITVKVTKDVNDVANRNRKVSTTEFNIQLIDFATGRLVKQITVNKGEISKQITVSDLKRGHYIVQIIENRNKTTRHIILQ